MNKEIEIKIQISPEQLKSLRFWLNEKSKFVDEVEHVEYYLDNPNKTFFFTSPQGYKDALKYLRVRLTEKGDSICYKDFYVDAATGKTTHCDEFETNVGDGQETLKLLENLGYSDQTLIQKKRQKYLWGDFEIVIDDVKDIGIFVEVELKAKEDNIKIALQRINNFLQLTGITQFRRQERGYVSMAWNPDYNFGEQIQL